MERAAPPAALGPGLGAALMESPPSCLRSGSVKVHLKKWSIWDKFYNLGTEMRMSKRGRFMFPYCEYSVWGLEPAKNYIMAMDISPVDSYRYRYNGSKWQLSGKATPHVMGRLYFHPKGSVPGREWMLAPLSFARLRLTNCPAAAEGHAILHSMHRYIPQLHIIVADGVAPRPSLDDPRVYTFVFQQTEFFAVTKYENKFIRQLKHFYNPYGTALRDVKGSKQDAANSRRPRKRCEKKPHFNAVQIHGATNDQESKKTIVPRRDGAIKIHENMNNQGPMKQMQEITPVENVLQKESFSAKGDLAELENLEQKLREELRWNGTHEILHPTLQKSGIKLSDLQLTECLNVKHLGLASVQNIELNSSFPVNESPGIRETGIPFISRTGKTNDLTKIKGWKHKFNLQPGSPEDKPSPPPSSANTAIIKNRSAFVSDLLDEYLEKEGKIIEQQSLLYDFEMPEIGRQTPTMLDSSSNIQQNTTRSPDYGTTVKNKPSHLEMSPVLEKHFSVTNKGIFIRDMRNTSMNPKARCKTQKKDISAAKRSKDSSPYSNTSELSNNNKPSGIYNTSPQKKQQKPGSTSLKSVHVVSSLKGGKKSNISGNQTEAIYTSDDKISEELEPRCVQDESAPPATLQPPSGLEHPSTTVNRSTASKAVEVISYCIWSESRVKIIKLIAECAMANKLPCTQRLDKFEIHLEKRDGTSLFPPKKNVDVRATIQNFTDSECAFDKPLVQTMVIEAVVGNTAFKTQLNNLISKASKYSSNQPLTSPVRVELDLEKNASPPEKCPSETSGGTTLPNRLTAEDKAQSSPTAATQKREQEAVTDTTVKNASKAPCPPIRYAVTTFQKIGALSTLLTNTQPTPTPSCFVNPVASQNKPETPSTPATRYLLCKTNSSALSSGSIHSLDQDSRRHCVALPNTLKLQPGENLMLRPIKAADGRQLYKHSSGKIFQLVYTKTPEQAPMQQLNVPQSPALVTSPLVEILTSTAAPTLVGATNTPHCNTAARSSELGAKTGSSETAAGGGLRTSTPLCDVDADRSTKPQLQISPTIWKLVDQVSPLQPLRIFPETTQEAGQRNRPSSIIPSTESQSKANVDELNNDKFDLKMETDPVKSPEPDNQRVVQTFPVKSKTIAVTGAYKTKWAPEIRKGTASTERIKHELNVDQPSETHVKVERGLSEINAGELVDPHSSEICTVTIKEEPLNDEEDHAFTALREESFRSSKFWNRSFNLNTEAVTEAELGVQTHSNSRSRDGFGNLVSPSRTPRDSLIVNDLTAPHRGFFQNSPSFNHLTKRKAFEPLLCEARKKAILHNLRERESRRMMENRFKVLKDKLFDDKQIASKGAILDEAIDAITNLDRQSKNLTMEKELLLGKQKILLEKISLLSEMGPVATQGGIEAGEIIDTNEVLNFLSGKVPSSPNSFGMKWFPEDGPLDDHKGDCDETVKYEVNSTSSDDIVAVKVGDDFSEKYNHELDYSGGTNIFTVEGEENPSQEDCSTVSSVNEECSGSSKFCSFADFSPDMDALNNMSMDVLGDNETPLSWIDNRATTPHTLRERESRKMMENRFKVLESTVFSDKKAPKSAILNKAIGIISDLDTQSEELFQEKELLMRKQNKLLEEISLLAYTRSDATEDQVEDGQLFGTKLASDARAVPFQNPSEPHWLKKSDLSDSAVIKGNTVSVLSEHHGDVCTAGVKWEQDELKATRQLKVKMAEDFKEQHCQEPTYPDGPDDSDPPPVRRKNCNGKDEDAHFTVSKESSIGSSDFGSHSDFDINTDEVNEIDVEILSHSESESADIEMEDGEVADETAATEKLCAPSRWHFHNYSQSPRFALGRKILCKSRKNPLLHTMREREWRKLMQERFSELRKMLFEDEKVSKRAILDEAINEIQNLCQQGEKLYLEKKLLMKKNKALIKIISVLSGEKKLKIRKLMLFCEKNSGDYDNGSPVSPGQSLPSVVKGNNEESILVPIAGTPFHLLLEKIAVSPRGEKFGERDCTSQTEAHRIKGVTQGSADIAQQLDTCSAFSEGYSRTSSSSTQPREEMFMQKLSKISVSGTVSKAIDAASKNPRTVQDTNAMDQNYKSTKDLLASNGDRKKPKQGALYWSRSVCKDDTADSLEKDQTDSRAGAKGKLQLPRSTKGQDILQKLARKVQEAGIKPWTWKSKRDDSENVPQNLFDSESKSVQCFQKATTSLSEGPISQCVYTETTELLVKDQSVHSFVPGKTLKQSSSLNRGGAGQLEGELDMDSNGSTTATCAVREPKILISSVDIHSANEANANGGYLLLDSTQ
ncbi:uncharacterized protein [Scyliorhinus torazame]|uniref:uncharacterized protein isoform X2 n=1 Tax=Scyliorhinus torazame TaxID=75743 RepID=UPI003B5C5607